MLLYQPANVFRRLAPIDDQSDVLHDGWEAHQRRILHARLHSRQQMVHHQLEEVDVLIDTERRRDVGMQLANHTHLNAAGRHNRRPAWQQAELLRRLERPLHAGDQERGLHVPFRVVEVDGLVGAAAPAVVTFSRDHANHVLLLFRQLTTPRQVDA